MAQRTTVQLVDDLDGGPADETLAFGLDGRSYEIDLSDVNAKQLRDSLEQYIGAARKTGGRLAAGKPNTGGSRPGRNPESSAIREWATRNGHQVNGRGRIPRHVVDAYHAAGN